MRLGLVTCYFNPCRCNRIVENYYRFVEGLGDYKHRLTTVALQLDNDDLHIHGPEIVTLRGHRPHYFLWQKEALLNHAMKLVPVCFNAIAWLDADILFPNSKSWLKDAEELLERYTIIQLFKKVRYLDQLGRFDSWREGVVYKANQGEFTNHSAYGLGWAGRRDIIENFLLDWCVTGNADTFMAEAWLGKMSKKRSSDAMYKEYVKWAEEQFAHTNGRVGYVNGEVYHLYHGHRKNRKYGYRNRLLQENGFDPFTHLERDGNGLWRWKDTTGKIPRDVMRWFEDRKDDE